MGYTHYWDFKKTGEITKEQKQLINDRLNLMLKHLPPFTESAGGYYTDIPLILVDENTETVITEFNNIDVITFNGQGEYGHETFYIDFGENDRLWGFCKTARKPYDLAVCVSLLIIKNVIPGFTYSSDGKADEWKEAKKFYKKHFTR